MENQEFSPRQSIERALMRWWIIVLATVLGGIAGWIFHLFQPPVYEATATITVTMEFNKWELTQAEEDLAFNSAEDIITSTQVKNQIIAEASTDGFPMDIYQLQQRMYYERKLSIWELHIRDRNPKLTAVLANIWADKALEVLNAALGHALKADALEYQISGMAKNLSTPDKAQEIQVAIKDWISELIQERSLSGGIISVMTFSKTGTAIAPEKPVLYNIADLVIAGAFIGFVISLWVVNSYKVQRRD